MKLFQLKNRTLTKIKEKKLDLERDIQRITEENLSTVFGLKFVRSEFTLQNFRIDTLAFDEESKSFVVIEYKRDKSFSVIDQGVSYLALMLNNKAEFVLEYNEKIGSNLKRNDVDWTQSRIIFIADSFTQYQQGALGFKDLPIELWEAKVFENGVVIYSPVKKPETKVSIKAIKKSDKELDRISREVKVYEIGDHFKENWIHTKELFDSLKNQILSLGANISERITKFYIAYINEDINKSFVEIVAQKQGVKIYLRPYVKELKSPLIKLKDCSKVGHWTNGNSYFILKKNDELPYAMELIKQAYKKVM